MSLRWTSSVFVASLALLTANQARAICWLDTVGEQAYIDLGNQARFLPVGQLLYQNPDGSFVPSLNGGGILINDEFVVSARHTVPGGSTTGIITIAGRTYVSSGWLQYPAMTSTSPGYDTTNGVIGGYDISIAHLDRRCTNVVPMGILQTDSSVGQLGTIVGYGAGGPGSLGQQSGSKKLRGGTNMIELDPSVPNILLTDFDDGTAANNSLSYLGSSAVPVATEAQLGDGDSGGGIFILSGGQTLLAGINSAQGTLTSGASPSKYGSLGIYSKIYPCLAWISANTKIAGKVSGKVTLSGANVGSDADLPMTMDLMVPGSSTVLETRTVPLAPDGSFSFVTTQRGNFVLRVKGDRWLRANSAQFSVSNAETAGVNVSLIPGDVTNHNTINLADFSALSAAYGSTVGGTGWNAQADLNLDGVVNLADFSLLSANYGLSGV